MSVHLSTSSSSSSSGKNARSPCTFVQMPPSSSSPPSSAVPSTSSSLPTLLDAALMTVVQQSHQPSHTPPPSSSDRTQFDPILINLAGVHQSLPSSSSPKLPKAGASTSASTSGTNGIPPPPPPPPLPLPPPSASNGPSQAQHHMPLLTAHSFLYNPVEPYIFPIAIPPGFPSAAPEFMRLFAPNMASVPTNASNPTGTNFVQSASVPQASASTTRSTTQSNGTNTPPEQNGQNHRPSPPPQSSSRHHHQQQQQQQHHPPQSHHRHRQYHQSDSMSFQQNGFHSQQQRQSQSSYSQQQHMKPKACYTCGDIGHLAFACPEQYSSDSNYSHNNRGDAATLPTGRSSAFFFRSRRLQTRLSSTSKHAHQSPSAATADAIELEFKNQSSR